MNTKLCTAIIACILFSFTATAQAIKNKDFLKLVDTSVVVIVCQNGRISHVLRNNLPEFKVMFGNGLRLIKDKRLVLLFKNNQNKIEMKSYSVRDELITGITSDDNELVEQVILLSSIFDRVKAANE
jgi:hypothetical protein